MKLLSKILTYLAVGIVMLMIGGLAGWYFFLRSKGESVRLVDAARGLGAAIPSFTGGEGGSTAQNIASVTQGATTLGAQSESGNAGGMIGRMWHTDKTPVAGMEWGSATSSSALYFVERANGYLFRADTIALKSARLSGTLLPKISEALVATDGSVLLRSVDDTGAISTFAATMSAASATSTVGSDSTFAPRTLTGAYLQTDIRNIALNPATRALFYLFTENGITKGISAEWNNPKAKPKEVFSSPLSSWRPQILADGRIILTISPVDGMAGYAYQLEKSGSLTPLVRNVPGLMVLPRASSPEVLYSSSSGNALSLYSQLTAASTTRLTIQTIADKCVWAHNAIIMNPATTTIMTPVVSTSTKAIKKAPVVKAPPVIKHLIAYCAVPVEIPRSTGFVGEWLRGTLHTTDTWWKVDATAGTAELIYTPAGDNIAALDVMQPKINANDTQIAFINARDASLWVFNIQK